MTDRHTSTSTPNETLIESFAGTATRTAGPVLLLWLTATAVEFLLLDFIGLTNGFTGWVLGMDGPPFSLFLAAAALPFIVAFRGALYRPAHRSFTGASPDLWEAFRSAITVVLPVMGAQFLIALVQISVLWLCQALYVPFPTFVVLPITFALTPTVYFAATRRIGAVKAARHALDLWRRHWLTVFAAHSLAIIVTLLLSDTPMAAGTVGSMRELGAHLTREYLNWLVLTAAYLHLDTRQR